MAGSNRGRPRPGGGEVAFIADDSTPVDVSKRTGFYITVDVVAWVVVTNDNTVITGMDATNATVLAPNFVYGPFDLMTGHDKFIHVAGEDTGGIALITVF
jgi:hypothetical protein